MRLILFLLFCCTPLWAQEWQAHTSFRQARLLVEGANQDLWVGTDGGIFRYNIQSKEVQRFTSIEGLHQINPTAMAFDASKNVLWLGYSDGVLDRITLQGNTVSTYRDIARANQFLQKGINRFSLKGDSLLVATQFGVVIFDTQKNEVRDSYTQLGTLSSGSEVLDVKIIDGNFYAIGQSGISTAPLRSPNLRNPTAWTTDSGLSNGVQIESFGGRLYAITNNALYLKSGNQWSNTGLSGTPRSLKNTNQGLLVTDASTVTLLKSGGETVVIRNGTYQNFNASVLDASGGLWVAEKDNGLLQFGAIPTSNNAQSVLSTVLPNSPYHQRMADMLFDANGTMWAIATEFEGGGVYRLDANGNWKSYVAQNQPAMQGRRSFDRMTIDKNGTLWFGSNSRGVMSIQPSTETIQLFDESNSTLRTLAGDANGFIRIGGVAADKNGSIWATNQFTQPNINIRNSSGVWNAFTPSFNGVPVTGVFNRFFIDSIDNKWIQFKQDGGLLWFNSRTTPELNSDDRVRWFRGQGASGFGLPAPQVMAVAEDRKGKLWIGTQRGIASVLITTLDNINNEVRPVWLRSGDSFVLREAFVNDLSIDPANRLWVASTSGAWLVDISNGDNAQILQHYTKDNSPLFSDNVLSIEVNPKTGRVYFATDVGLMSWQGDAVSPKTAAEDLYIFPNPAVANNGALPEIKIDRLVDDTQIRITTMTGDVVAQLQSFGGRASWNGKDQNGENVPSGIYLVLAVANNGEGTATGKVVIVR